MHWKNSERPPHPQNKPDPRELGLCDSIPSSAFVYIRATSLRSCCSNPCEHHHIYSLRWRSSDIHTICGQAQAQPAPVSPRRDALTTLEDASVFQKGLHGAVLNGSRVLNQACCLGPTCWGLRGRWICEWQRDSPVWIQKRFSNFESASKRFSPKNRPYKGRVVMRLLFNLFIHGAGFQPDNCCHCVVGHVAWNKSPRLALRCSSYVCIWQGCHG